MPTLGQTRSFGYDDRGRLEVSTTAAMPPTPSFETARTFFPDGKLATETVTDLVSSAAWTSEYAYDGAGRLTEELVGKTGARHVYALDAAGNRLSTTTTDALGAVTTAMTATYADPRLTDVRGTPLGYDAWNHVTADHHGNQYARTADGALAVLSRAGVGVPLSRNARGEPIAEVEGLILMRGRGRRSMLSLTTLCPLGLRS